MTFYHDSIDDTVLRVDPAHGIPEVYWPKKREWHDYPDGLEGTLPISDAEAAKLIPSADLSKPRTSA